jgi:VanZ family protein
MKFKAFVPAILWLIFSTVLLLLPSSDLPKSRWFDFPYFDKLVHLGMFLLLTALFCYPFSIHSSKEERTPWYYKIAILVVLYGILIEVVQKFLVKERSFDLVDIIFDGVGSLLGIVAIDIFSKKNRPR